MSDLSRDELTEEGLAEFRLARAIQNGFDGEAIHLIRTEDIDLDKIVDGKTFLSHALRWGMTSVAKELLKAGADVNQRDDEGVTPLMVAVAVENEIIVRHLLEEHQSEINARAKKTGATALMWAVSNDAGWDIIDDLIKAGADWEMADEKGRTVIDIAAEFKPKYLAGLESIAARKQTEGLEKISPAIKANKPAAGPSL